MTKNDAIIVRSLRVASKFSYATIAELASSGSSSDFEHGKELCVRAREHFPEDDQKIWEDVEF